MSAGDADRALTEGTVLSCTCIKQTLACNSTPPRSLSCPKENGAEGRVKEISIINTVTIIGFVGSDPEQRQAKGNASKFTVLSEWPEFQPEKEKVHSPCPARAV
jgi:hypothetical protein